MNFRALAFLDVSNMTATLITKYREEWGRETRRQDYPGSPHHDTQSILLRGPKDPDADNWFSDVPHEDYELLRGWKSAKALLTRLRDAVQPFYGEEPARLGKVMLVRLKPGGHVDWHTDEGAYAETHDRLHLCLIPSPGAFLYSGGEQHQPPVGQLTWINNRLPHAALNMGPVMRTHLIVDIRRPASPLALKS